MVARKYDRVTILVCSLFIGGWVAFLLMERHNHRMLGETAVARRLLIAVPLVLAVQAGLAWGLGPGAAAFGMTAGIGASLHTFPEQQRNPELRRMMPLSGEAAGRIMLLAILLNLVSVIPAIVAAIPARS